MSRTDHRIFSWYPRYIRKIDGYPARSLSFDLFFFYLTRRRHCHCRRRRRRPSCVSRTPRFRGATSMARNPIETIVRSRSGARKPGGKAGDTKRNETENDDRSRTNERAAGTQLPRAYAHTEELFLQTRDIKNTSLRTVPPAWSESNV